VQRQEEMLFLRGQRLDAQEVTHGDSPAPFPDPFHRSEVSMDTMNDTAGMKDAMPRLTPMQVAEREDVPFYLGVWRLGLPMAYLLGSVALVSMLLGAALACGLMIQVMVH
jgi:hypothetical protein